jgi:arylsulfatase A-like enzyme
MAAGWAVALDTPFQWTKQVASDHGGTKVGMAVRWPAGHQEEGRIRTAVPPRHRRRAHHPGGGRPAGAEMVNGVPQRPMDGVSMAYSFGDAKANGPPHDPVLRDVRQSRHVPRRLVSPGRSTRRRGRGSPRRPWRRLWELYDTRTDFSLVNNLRRRIRRSSPSCRPCSWQEAEKNQALPIDDRVFERVNAELVGRPDLMAGRTSITLAEGMTGMTENVS